MDLFGIDLAHIVDLGTQVAAAGAIRVGEIVGDDVFESLVGIAVLVHLTELDGM